MLSVLVTGVSGFIGSNLLAYVKKKKLQLQIIGVDKNPSNYFEPWFQFLQKDVLDLQVSDLSGIDFILHLAARTGVRQSSIESSDYLQQNVVATQHLLELAVKANVKRFYFASSSSVYGDFPEQPEGDVPIQPIYCKSFYALTKQQCETMTYFYSKQYPILCIALRFFTVYGPKPRQDMLIGNVIHSTLNNIPTKFFGNPSSIYRSFTFVDDVLSYIFKLFDAQTLPKWSVWNIGNPNTVKCSHVLELLTQELARYSLVPSIEYTAYNELDTLQTCANIQKASDVLGWTPQINIEEGIHLTVKSRCA